MLRCALSVLMGKWRVRIADVARETGISRNQLTRLYHDQARRVELGDLEKLCSYFECGLDDLFELVPDSEGTERPVVHGHTPGTDRKNKAGS